VEVLLLLFSTQGTETCRRRGRPDNFDDGSNVPRWVFWHLSSFVGVLQLRERDLLWLVTDVP